MRSSPVRQPGERSSEDITHLDAAKAHTRIRAVRLVGVVLAFLVVAWLLFSAITNPRFQWDVVVEYLFNPTVLGGLAMTLYLTVAVMIVGSLLGMVIATGQLSTSAPIRWLSVGYVGVFRGVPPLVQLIFWFNLAYLVPRLSVGIPFGPELFSMSTNDLITPLTAAVIALSLHEAAYMAEVIRAGIISVDNGQQDAARAMGFTSVQTFWKVTLPQAMRVIIPPTGSQFISLLKGTSLVSVITLTDLFYSVQIIYNRNYQVVPLLLVAVIWYLVIVTLLTMLQRRVERNFGRGYDKAKNVRARKPSSMRSEVSA